jgi:spore germination cell wall hydrolase CwlJ-like protein
VLLACAAGALLAPWLAGSRFIPRQSLSAEEARALNDSIPFAPGLIERPTRFVFRGSPGEKGRAVECLATAALYEAGHDERGQKAVIQLILNRVRHPAFPKTICGVVYEGVGRSTGCQFSFVCDGSLYRRPEHEGWALARMRARRALSGYVFADIGTATYYHADWVVPYWNRSLAKVANVHGHIFYRSQTGTENKIRTS